MHGADMNTSTLRTIILIWLAWAVVLIGYQSFVAARLQLARPDKALDWTATETTATSQNDKPYLIEPLMNAQVAWDSEFYLSIGTVGYDDPAVRAVGPRDIRYSLNYAFLPFYPFVMRVIALPLRAFGLTPIATSTLAGVLVSLLGTLAGMLALVVLVRDELKDADGIRAAFYLLIFPTGFFLAQVYTEGLFVGLAFGCLALIRRGHRLWAAVLAVLATLTRAVGVALVIPLALPWLTSGDWMELDLEWKQIFYQGLPWKGLGKALVALAPLAAYLVWRFSRLGAGFDFVESNFFGRGALSLGASFMTWTEAFRSLWGGNPQRVVYYLIEFGAIALGLVSFWQTRRTHPDAAWFSLAVIVISLTSGPAQGMHRYVLTAPSVFIALARWGRRPTFDRAWSIASILLMGLLATLFTFDMWVA
jgi:hypothetical protein